MNWQSDEIHTMRSLFIRFIGYSRVRIRDRAELSVLSQHWQETGIHVSEVARVSMSSGQRVRCSVNPGFANRNHSKVQWGQTRRARARGETDVCTNVSTERTRINDMHGGGITRSEFGVINGTKVRGKCEATGNRECERTDISG